MPLFNRKTPQSVMGRPGQPEGEARPAPAQPAPPPRPREMKAENRPQEGNTLMEDMSPKRPQGSPAPQAPNSPTGVAETFISGDTVIEGTIHAKNELRIDGTFKGEVRSNSRVVVGTAGKLEATVEAKVLVVSGRVVGNLKVHERLELLSTGEIFGDLQTQPGALIIEKGARLEGRCSMGLDEGEKKPPMRPAVAGAPQQPQAAPSPAPQAQPQQQRNAVANGKK